MPFNFATKAIIISASLCVGAYAWGQDDAGASPREAAPIDLTGYWVSVVTEDWRWRMVIPPKGDYASVPLSEEGRRVADTWDPRADVDSCKPYGAAGVMRMPMRIHVTWEDDETLRIDTDHGMQTRLLYFNRSGAIGGQPTLQGNSRAQWGEESTGIDRERFAETNRSKTLKVVTDNLTPGYLRANGVPYSANTVVTEYFDRHSDYGEEWITVTTIVNDLEYLAQEFITSSSFKQLSDGSTWHPVPCGST